MTAPPVMPTWEQFMLPVLRLLADGTERSGREIKDLVRVALSLSAEQRAMVMDSGYNLSDNRIAWAMSQLTMATALRRPRRANGRRLGRVS